MMCILSSVPFPYFPLSFIEDGVVHLYTINRSTFRRLYKHPMDKHLLGTLMNSPL
jgi:hypothetical protein